MKQKLDGKRFNNLNLMIVILLLFSYIYHKKKKTNYMINILSAFLHRKIDRQIFLFSIDLFGRSFHIQNEDDGNGISFCMSVYRFFFLFSSSLFSSHAWLYPTIFFRRLSFLFCKQKLIHRPFFFFYYNNTRTGRIPSTSVLHNGITMHRRHQI